MQTKRKQVLTPAALQQPWIEKFTLWAKNQRDIRAALVMGSRGRTDQYTADEWSDLDIAFITTKPDQYIRKETWMQDISPFWAGIVDPEENFGGLATACAFSVYQAGLVVDFAIISKRRIVWITRLIRLLNRYPGLWRRLPSDTFELGQELAGFFQLGIQVLFDQDQVVKPLQRAALAIPATTPSPPSLQEFQRNADGFWIDPPRVVSYLQRGDLMGAVESTRAVKKQVLKIVEWHARAKNGWKDDGAWYRLKYIDHWADPHVLAKLSKIYARYDLDDMWQALFEMMDLYQLLIAETAALFGFDYSSTVGAQVIAWARQCYAEKED